MIFLVDNIQVMFHLSSQIAWKKQKHTKKRYSRDELATTGMILLSLPIMSFLGSGRYLILV